MASGPRGAGAGGARPSRAAEHAIIVAASCRLFMLISPWLFLLFWFWFFGALVAGGHGLRGDGPAGVGDRRGVGDGGQARPRPHTVLGVERGLEMYHRVGHDRAGDRPDPDE